jgi:hypothetical protein
MSYPEEGLYIQIVYDPKTDQALLLGGTLASTLGSNSSATYLFDPQTMKWNVGMDMPLSCGWSDPAVYDSQAERVLLYCDKPDAVWEYDFTTDKWRDRKATNSPKGSGTGRMAYDSESNKTILIGGIDFSTSKMLDETWVYDYPTNAWTKMNPKTQPPGVYAHAMAYDSESDRVILWGGVFFTGNWNGDNWGDYTAPDNLAWAYDYNTDTWESFPVKDGLQYPRFIGLCNGVEAIYDSTLDRTFFYWDDQIWGYDYNHNAWEKAKGDVQSGAGSRQAHGMAYLSSIQQFLIFGGASFGSTFFEMNFDDKTWLYDPQSGDWTQVGP